MMRTIEAIENATDGSLQATHIFDIPICCPVSKNPRPGSTLKIIYNPVGKSLEVGSLFAYIHQFKGGLRDSLGQLMVRDMEGMLLQIARECSLAIDVPVQVIAYLVLVPTQEMEVVVWSHSVKEKSRV